MKIIPAVVLTNPDGTTGFCFGDVPLPEGVLTVFDGTNYTIYETEEEIPVAAAPQSLLSKIKNLFTN